MKRTHFYLFASLFFAVVMTGCLQTHQTQQASAEAVSAARRNLYVNTHPELAQNVKSKILQGTVSLNMTTDEVTASWGAPNTVNRTGNSWGVHEQWVYGENKRQYLYFKNGKLTSWQE